MDASDTISGIGQPSGQPEGVSPPTVSGVRLAGAWPRFWARMLDITAFSFILGIPLGRAMPGLFVTGGPFVGGRGMHLLGFALLPFALMLEACASAAFGNSPGKMILGLGVRTLDGKRLSFGEVLVRNLRVYLAGLAIGLPLLNLVALRRNHEKVTKGELTWWDARMNTRTMDLRGSTARTWFGAIAYVALLVGFNAREAMGSMASLYPGSWPRSVRTVTVEEQLAAMAREINKMLPRKLDDTTRLIELVAGPGKNIKWVHTVALPAGFQPADEVASMRRMRAGIRDEVCGKAALKPYLSKGAVVTYAYADERGRSIGEIVIEPSDCPP
jgi:uncharacterized RDD family membrane protein YckC